MEVLFTLKTQLCYINLFCLNPKCGILVWSLVCAQLIIASCGVWSWPAGNGLPPGAQRMAWSRTLRDLNHSALRDVWQFRETKGSRCGGLETDRGKEFNEVASRKLTACCICC